MGWTSLILAYDVTGHATVLSWRGRDGQRGSLALREPRATSALLPAIQRLLLEARDSLERLAVIRGPGSFTGIRVALATAVGLRLALNIPVFAFSKFEVMAFQVGQQDATLLLPAQGDRVYQASSRKGRVMESYRLCPASDFSAAENCYGVQPLEGVPLRLLRSDFTNVCLDLLERETSSPGGGSLEPLYIRPPDAKINLTLLQKLRKSELAGDDNPKPIC